MPRCFARWLSFARRLIESQWLAALSAGLMVYCSSIFPDDARHAATSSFMVTLHARRGFRVNFVALSAALGFDAGRRGVSRGRRLCSRDGRCPATPPGILCRMPPVDCWLRLMAFDLRFRRSVCCEATRRTDAADSRRRRSAGAARSTTDYRRRVLALPSAGSLSLQITGFMPAALGEYAITLCFIAAAARRARTTAPLAVGRVAAGGGSLSRGSIAAGAEVARAARRRSSHTI